MHATIYKQRTKRMMSNNRKPFLSYDDQMNLLRNKKKIACGMSTDINHTISVGNPDDKEKLVRLGYFNLINGYKEPFVNGKTHSGDHTYLPRTSLEQIYYVKKFDDNLRLFLLKYITQVEEEIRTLAGYKFDQYNDFGKKSWYETIAYDNSISLQKRMGAISAAYSELSRSKQKYVRFYMDQHTSIPTWIMFKVVNFSTFINVLQNSKKPVCHSICKLYDITDDKGYPNVKLLIGSLNWMRIIRNSCAHNERVYCISQSGRIKERFFPQLNKSYSSDPDKSIMDLIVYLKYYLPDSEFNSMTSELTSMLKALQNRIPANAFDNIRGKMGIKDLNDLNSLANIAKKKIDYIMFDRI